MGFVTGSHSKYNLSPPHLQSSCVVGAHGNFAIDYTLAYNGSPAEVRITSARLWATLLYFCGDLWLSY